MSEKKKSHLKTSVKLSKVGKIGGIWGRIGVFLITLIAPVVLYLLLFMAIVMVMGGGMVAVITADKELNPLGDGVYGNTQNNDEKSDVIGGGDLSNRVINIPDEMKGKMLYPVGNKISSNRNPNRCFAGRCRAHLGVDLAGGFNLSNAPEVYPVYPGKVFKVTSGTGLGNHVVLEHTSGGQTIYSSYGHMQKVYVKEGDVVGYNNKIGRMGNTGGNYAVHLHLEFHSSMRPSGFGTWASTLEPLDILQCTADSKIQKRKSDSPEVPIKHCYDYRKKVTAGLE